MLNQYLSCTVQKKEVTMIKLCLNELKNTVLLESMHFLLKDRHLQVDKIWQPFIRQHPALILDIKNSV